MGRLLKLFIDKGKSQVLLGVVYQFIPTFISLLILSMLDIAPSRVYLIYLVSIGLVNLFVDYSYFSLSPFLIDHYGVRKSNIIIAGRIFYMRFIVSLIACIFVNLYVYVNDFTVPCIILLDFLILLNALMPLSTAFMLNRLSSYYLLSILSRIIQVVFVMLFYPHIAIELVLCSFVLYFLLFSSFHYRLLFFFLKKDRISLFWKRDEMVNIAKKGWGLFKGNLITSAYTIFLPMFLPFLLRGIELTNFLIAEKSVRPFCYLQIPLQQKTYSDLSVVVKERSFFKKRFILIRYTLIYFMLFLPIPILFQLFGEALVRNIFSNQYNLSVVENAKIASFIVPVIAVSNVVGLQILPLLGKVKSVNIGIGLTAVFSFVFYWLMAVYYNSYGASIALLCSELFITIYLLIVMLKIIYGQELRRHN